MSKAKSLYNKGKKAVTKKAETLKEKANKLKKSISCKATKAANKVKSIDKKITKTLSSTKGKNAAIRFAQGAASNLYKQGKGLGKTMLTSLAKGQSPLQGILFDSAKGMAGTALHPVSTAKGIKDYYSSMAKEKGWAYTAGDLSVYAAEAVAMRKVTRGPDYAVKKSYSAEVANKWWAERGYKNPPYKAGTTVSEIELLRDSKFVRVYDGIDSGQAGGWVMKKSSVRGLSPEQIRDKYALPEMPQYVTSVKLPKGTTIRTGIAGELEWGKGGGIQYDLMQKKIGKFYNEQKLK